MEEDGRVQEGSRRGSRQSQRGQWLAYDYECTPTWDTGNKNGSSRGSEQIQKGQFLAQDYECNPTWDNDFVIDLLFYFDHMYLLVLLVRVINFNQFQVCLYVT